MALVDKLDQTPQRQHGLPCSIGAVLDSLPDDEAKALNAMLHELGWPAKQIDAALKAEGYTVGFQTINRHRGRVCRCYR